MRSILETPPLTCRFSMYTSKGESGGSGDNLRTRHAGRQPAEDIGNGGACYAKVGLPPEPLMTACL